MGITAIQYNNFNLPFTTPTIKSRPIFAIKSMQLMYYETLIQVSGWLSADNESDFATLIANARQQLQQPGAVLKVGFNDSNGNFNPSWQVLSGEDIQFGPKPSLLDLDHFNGGLTCRYSWSIVCFTKNCLIDSGYGSTPSSQPISATIPISFLYKQSQTIDMNGYSTIRITGSIVCSSQILALGYNADYFRSSMVIPWGGITNMKNQGQEFSLSEDGLTLNYSSVFQEVAFVFPTGITSGQVMSTLRVRQTGMIVDFSMGGWFGAKRTTPKSAILNVIGNLIEQKLSGYFNNPSNPVIFTDRDIGTSEYENKVTFHVRAYFTFGIKFGTQLNSTFYNAAVKNLITAYPAVGTKQPEQIGWYGDIGQSIMYSPLSSYDACYGAGNTSSITSPTGSTNPNSTQAGYNSPGGTTGTQPETPSSGGTTSISGVSNSGSLDYPQVSQTHLTKPILEYAETYSFSLDTGVTILVPKIQGASPIAQRSRAPVLTIIQIGRAVQSGQSANDAPQVPPPIFGGTSSPASGSSTSGVNNTTVVGQNSGGTSSPSSSISGSGSGSSSTQAVVLEQRVDLMTPEPICEGSWWKFGVTWMYKMVLISPAITTGLGDIALPYPNDARALPPSTPITINIPYVTVESP